MAQSRAESTRDTYNYGQYLNQFPPNTIKVIREFERIQKKTCRRKMSIMLNEIWIYMHIYIYIPICELSTLGRKFAGYHIRWTAKGLLKNCAFQIADNVYVERYM